jgi:hypothetical protein
MTPGMSRLPLVMIVVAGVASADSTTVKSKVTFGAPVVTGSLTARSIIRVVEKSERKLVACHEGALKLEGAVDVSFTIDGKGAVTTAKASGFADNVDTCVAQVFEKMKFGRSKDGHPVDVTYPITFRRPGVFDDNTIIYGSRIDLTSGEMNGGVGFGRSGFGPDKGGTGWGTIGTGRYGTIGKGSGKGAGYGVGPRLNNEAGTPGGMQSRNSSATLSLGQPTVGGNLDKAIIRRYLKRNIQKLTYCYEKQLLANPKLEGTVTLELTIEDTGVVSTATAKGVDTNVETCIADVAKGIEFPKPKSGSVKSTWPLKFKPSGAR